MLKMAQKIDPILLGFNGDFGTIFLQKNSKILLKNTLFLHSYFKERRACHFFGILGQKVRPVNSYKSPMLGTRFRFLGGF